MAIVGKWWNPYIYVGPYKLDADLKQVALTADGGLLDYSTFGQTTKINGPGITSFGFTCTGLMSATSAADLKEKQLFDNVGLANIPITIMPWNTPVNWNQCYFLKAIGANLQFGSPHGQLYPFTLTAQNAIGYPMMRGEIMETGLTAKTITGTGQIADYGSWVTATQKVYAVLHVHAMTTPTSLIVTLESDDAEAFTTPTTRATFATVTTAVSSQYLTPVAGPINEQWWRASWTIVGTSYTFAVAMKVA